MPVRQVKRANSPPCDQANVKKLKVETNHLSGAPLSNPTGPHAFFTTKMTRSASKDGKFTPKGSNILKRLQIDNFDEYERKASEVINFKMVKNEDDLLPVQHGGLEPFHPTYTHQFFPSETILGFKDIRVDIFFTACSLFCYLHIHYTKERAKTKNSDLSDLGKRIQPGFTTDLCVFRQHIDEEFTPPGALVHTYTLADYEGEFEIYRGDFRDEAVRHYHERLQYFLLFFIDRSSYIDETDPVWEILLVFHKRIINGQPKHFCIGYTTLYKFLWYPDRWRLRVSQILILPPYQRQGHGQRLLQYANQLAHERGYAEVNIEDPAAGFQFLRDLTDLQNCKTANFYDHLCEDNSCLLAADGKRKTPARKLPGTPKCAAKPGTPKAATPKAGPKAGTPRAGTPKSGPRKASTAFPDCPACEWSESYAAHVRAQMRITKQQIRRLYEVRKLAAIDPANDEQYRKYKAEVKKRLLRTHAEQLVVMTSDDGERKRKLNNYYKKEEAKYLTLLKKAGIPSIMTPGGPHASPACSPSPNGSPVSPC